MPLASGSRLGPYEIQSPIGAGGMGEVYKARDTRLDRTVAIKVLPPHVASDPQFRERFDREARTVAALNHPHICTLHDIGNQDGIDFLVMEYLDGQTLADRLTKGALSLDQALKFAIEIADALDKAHRQVITHRDLKPGNIILTKGGAKLLDFGLAKTGAPVVAGAGLWILPTTPPNLTAQGTILDTFQYMAPEQLEGQEADARTDIFAFGAVVYEMVTGRKAFEGKNQASSPGHCRLRRQSHVRNRTSRFCGESVRGHGASVERKCHVLGPGYLAPVRRGRPWPVKSNESTTGGIETPSTSTGSRHIISPRAKPRPTPSTATGEWRKALGAA